MPEYGTTVKHRPEDLLLGDPHVVGADEDGGLVEEALVEALRPLATGQQLGSLLDAGRHVSLDPLPLLLADQRSEDRGRVPGVADLDRRRGGRHAFLVGVEQVLGQQQAGGQNAALAAVGQHRAEADGAGVVLGDVVENHLGALAAQLELVALHRGARRWP